MAHLLSVKAAGNDYCSYVCGSAANSSNPAEQMNRLMSTGVNCSSPPSSPLNNPSYPPMPGAESCIQNYQGGGGNPYSQLNSPSTQPSYPTQPSQPAGPFQSPQQGPQQQPGSNQECEMVTTLECKPKTPGSPAPQNQGSPTYPNSSPFSPQQGPGTPGPFSNQQQCDCSQQQPQMPMGGPNQPMNNGPSPYSSLNTPPGRPCDCNSPYNNLNRPAYPYPTEPQAQPLSYPPAGPNRPNFCNPESGPGPNNSSYVRPNVNNAILNAFDCGNVRNSQPFGMPPTKNIIVGTTELPAALNFTAYPSSCGPQSGACP